MLCSKVPKEDPGVIAAYKPNCLKWEAFPTKQKHRESAFPAGKNQTIPTDSVIPRNIAASLFCALLSADRLRPGTRGR